jgi:hypothetical protein
MAGRIALVEGQLAFDRGRQTVPDDLEVGRANGHRVYAHQDFGGTRLGDRLFDQSQFLWPAEDPSSHGLRDRVFVAHPPDLS